MKSSINVFDKKFVAPTAIVFLLILNLWRWWPDTDIDGDSLKSADNKIYDLASYSIYGVWNKPEESLGFSNRDIFFNKQSFDRQEPVKKNRDKDDLSRLASRRLDDVQLSGFLRQDGLSRSFLLVKGEAFVVALNKTFTDEFKLSAMGQDYVEIEHLPSGLKRIFYLPD